MNKRLLMQLKSIPIQDVLNYYHIPHSIGHNMTCPFSTSHPTAGTNNTPSARIYLDSNSISCFGCRKNRDPIGLVMEREGLSFDEAAKKLQTLFNIKDMDTNYFLKKTLKKIGTREETYKSAIKDSYWSETFYSVRDLPNAQYIFNIAYLAKDSYTCDNFMLLISHLKQWLEGNDKDSLNQFLTENSEILDTLKQNVSILKELKRTSIVDSFLSTRGFNSNDYIFGQHEDFPKTSEFFQLNGRVLFPIIFPPNLVVGFVGRTPQKSSFKYFTKVMGDFTKKDILFGLPDSKQDFMIVVEGPLDVLRLKSLGFQNVVSPIGVFIQPQQAKIIGSYTKNVLLMFDGDEGGRRAEADIRKEMEKQKFNIQSVFLPEGEDPDSYGLKDPKELVNLISNVSFN